MSKIETAAEAGRALIAEHLIQGGPGDADTLELAATLCNAAPALIAALKEARQWIAKGVADGAYNGCAAPLAPNRWLDRCGAILSRIDGAGDTLPDAPVPAPTSEAKPHLFTVIWGNIGDDNGKRLDHVSVESADQNLIMDAAFECFFKDLERSGQTLTAEDREEFRHNTAYDGYAVLPGHVTDAPGMGFF